jgi:hypothetical protein
MKKTALTKNNGSLDKLWRTIGKTHAHCEICQTLPPEKRFKYTKLDPHHIIKRGHKATRWDLKNRIWVCARHHTLGMWDETVQDNIGGWFLNWESDNDWMGQHRKEDKEYLRGLKGATKQWSLGELEKLYEHLKRLLAELETTNG